MTPSEVINKLDTLGYFKYTRADKLDQVKQNLATSLAAGKFTYDFGRYDTEQVLGSLDMRWYGLDAENLAEGGISYALNVLYSTLKLMGIPPFTVADVDAPDSSYFIRLNSEDKLIYSIADSENSWALAPKRLMEIVNEMLQTAGVEERLYGHLGGNDQVLVFLTPDLADFLNSEFFTKPTSPDVIYDSSSIY